MKNSPIHLNFEEGVENGSPVRRVILDGVTGPVGPHCEIWWRFPGQNTLPPVDVLDSFAGAFVLWASALRQDLIVHGPMTRGGVRNLDQLLETRCRVWPPGRYAKIEIQPDTFSEVDFTTRSPGRTLAAFSGGLDSTFTVMRHAKRLLGDRSFSLDGLVLVLGFDVPLDRADRFTILRNRSERFAKSLSLPLLAVETNGLHFSGGTWPQSAMPLFGSVLSQCTGSNGMGIVSGGAAYGSAYGSFSHTSALDALCTNDAFTLVSDGSGFNRTEKVDLLLNYPEVLPDLRVCWQGPDPSRNCGVCEKCIVTRLNFLAAGLKNPACFDTPLSMEHIENIPLTSVTGMRDYFRFCLETINIRGIRGPEADLFRRRMSLVPPDHLAPIVWRWVKRLRGLTRSTTALSEVS